MELLIALVAVLVLLVIASTVSALLRDGRGHTPPVISHEPWSALDLPSSSYLFRIF